MPLPIRRVAVLSVIVAVGVLAAPPLSAQKIDEAKRIRNREQLLTTLREDADTTLMNFERSKVIPFNFSAMLTAGLTYAESLEVVIGATDVDTIFMRAFPKVKGAYLNVDKARDPIGVMRQLLKLSGRTFCHWGTDADGDIYYGFTFTLESGFPSNAIKIVLRSVKNHDQYLKELLPAYQ